MLDVTHTRSNNKVQPGLHQQESVALDINIHEFTAIKNLSELHWRKTMTPAQLWAIYWNGDVISSHRSFSDFIALLIKLYSRFSPNRAPGTARDERTCLHIHQTPPVPKYPRLAKGRCKVFFLSIRESVAQLAGEK